MCEYKSHSWRVIRPPGVAYFGGWLLALVKQSGIYFIRNRVNGKCYVGSTNDWGNRKARHKRCLRAGKHQNIHLQRAWNLHGEDAFEFLWICDVPPECLLDIEQQWLDANPDGYNIAKCAEAFNRGRKYGPMTPGHREKIATALRGRKRSEEDCAKMSAAQKAIAHKTRERMLGHSVSEETRRKISAFHKGRPLTPEHKAKISAGLSGNQHTKGRRLSAEHKEKLRIAGTGRKLTEEHKAKIIATKTAKRLEREASKVNGV